MSLVHTLVAQVVAKVPFTPGHEMVGEVSHHVLFQSCSHAFVSTYWFSKPKSLISVTLSGIELKFDMPLYLRTGLANLNVKSLISVTLSEIELKFDFGSNSLSNHSNWIFLQHVLGTVLFYVASQP